MFPRTVPRCCPLAFPQGELFGRINKVGRFPDEVAKFYAAEVALALSYLHDEAGVVYRDLKPDNVLIAVTGHVLLADFGFARKVGNAGGVADGLIFGDECGTSQYLAPEITSGKGEPHGKAVDWWAFGCLVYEMLTGRPPYGDTSKLTKYEVFIRINAGKVKYPRASVSPDARELLERGLLVADQRVRWRWDAVAACAWFATVDFHALHDRRIPPPFLPMSDGGRPLAIGDHKHFIDWGRQDDTQAFAAGTDSRALTTVEKRYAQFFL